MKNRLAVLISGRGSNMIAIADNCRAGLLDAEISFVASDRPDAPGLSWARGMKIPVRILPYSSQGRESAEKWLDDLLDNTGTDWLALAGFMRILSPEFVAKRKGRVINIHPSLLPSFPGRNSIREAYDHGVKITGVTVHFVDELVDHGKIIAQEPVRILPDDTIEDLEERIHMTEHVLFSRALMEIMS